MNSMHEIDRTRRGYVIKGNVFFSLFLVALVAGATPVAAQTVVLRCGWIIDGQSNERVANVSVLVRDGRIVEMGSDVRVPSGARQVDLSESTCLPGLIDLHVHLHAGGMNRSSAAKALGGLKGAQELLSWGFTTLRVPGDDGAYYFPISVRRLKSLAAFSNAARFLKTFSSSAFRD